MQLLSEITVTKTTVQIRLLVCVRTSLPTHTKFVPRCKGHVLYLEFRMLWQVYTLQR